MLKAALFRLDPETAHNLAMVYLGRAHRSRLVRATLKVPASDPRLNVHMVGLDFQNPLGMAAGFDKEAHAYNALLAMGFGHVELGTVTPEPQPGNPKPRVHRFPEQNALVNAMGFPGPGFEAIQQRVARVPAIGPIGLNIGPNKEATREESLRRLQHMATEAAGDYVALNISSPNTPGLRELQDPKIIAPFISKLKEAMAKPLFLKLHPDAPNAELLATAKAAVDAGVDGIIATNTTRERPADLGSKAAQLPGGLSGSPLRERALDAVGALHNGLGREVPIIGVGGVSTGADVLAMMQAGASLVQAYTGFIYRGPRMASLVQQELLVAMDVAGIDRLDALHP